MVDADQWEANRATAREADAVFDAELLRRAQQWQEEAGEYSSRSAAAAAADEAGISGVGSSPPPRAYEHEHSQHFVDGARVAGASAPEGTQRTEQGGNAGFGTSKEQGGGAADANRSAAAAKTGLVGIMFDAMV